MAFRKARQSRLIEAAMDITPLIDVVFLLVIFLLITTTFKKKQLALELNLPRAGQSEFRVSNVEHALRIDQQGGMYLCPNAKVKEGSDAMKCTAPTDKAKLLKLFKKLAKEHPDIRVGIYANADVSYHWIVKVVAAATEAGLDLNLPYETDN